jgi:uncharacterized membrane protein
MRFIPFFIILFSVSVQAYSFNSYKINAQIDEGMVTQTLTVDMFNDDVGSITSGSLSLPPDAHILELRDTSGALVYNIQLTDLLQVRYNLSVPLGVNDSRIVTIIFTTSMPIAQKDDYTEYTSTMTLQKAIPGFEFILKLPESAELYSASTIVPEAEVRTVEGRVWITWKMDVLTSGTPHAFIVKYVEQRTDYTLFLIIPILAIIFAFLYAFREPLMKPFEKKKRLKLLNNLKFVNETEKDILHMIITRRQVPQYEIKKELNLSKSSLSRFLSNLEKRGIIIKEKRGKVNKWSLNPEKQ